LYALTAVADTFGGKAEFRLPLHEHLIWCSKSQFFKYGLKILAIYSLFYSQPMLSWMTDVISYKGFQKWESGLQPTLLSCLFSVKPQAGQAAYLFQVLADPWLTEFNTLIYLYSYMNIIV
jgi:hypothetical protein